MKFDVNILLLFVFIALFLSKILVSHVCGDGEEAIPTVIPGSTGDQSNS